MNHFKKRIKIPIISYSIKLCIKNRVSKGEIPQVILNELKYAYIY